MSLSVDTLIWLAATLTEVVVIGLLFYRRIWRTLPVFCGYCIWDVLSNVIDHYYQAKYFQILFAQAILDSAFLICVLVELVWSVLRPLRASLPRSAMLLVGALIVVAGAAIWPFAALPGLEHATSRMGLVFAQLEQTTSILRILFFLLLAGGSQLLSIGWRDRELQVATGLGLYSIVSLTVSVLQTHQTTASQWVYLFRFETASYVCCLVYWAFSFARQEAERREFTPQMQNFLLAVAGSARATRVAMTESRAEKPPKRG